MLVFLKKRMVTHPLFQGWLVGLEPTASRATIWRASQLRHSHHITTGLNPVPSLKGFEPPTHGLEGRCSIQLSYRLTKLLTTQCLHSALRAPCTASYVLHTTQCLHSALRAPCTAVAVCSLVQFLVYKQACTMNCTRKRTAYSLSR